MSYKINRGRGPAGGLARRIPWKHIITLCWVGFIFFNSLMDSAVSTRQSGVVLEVVQKVVAEVGGNPAKVTMHFIRKMAHFTEYGILGFLLAKFAVRERKSWLYQPLFFGLLTPVLDEGLQLLTPGRAGMVQDVLLDFSGVLTGICAAGGIWCLYRRFIHRKSPLDRQG